MITQLVQLPVLRLDMIHTHSVIRVDCMVRLSKSPYRQYYLSQENF